MLTGFFIYSAGKTNITVTDSCAIYLPLFPFSLIIFIKAYFKCIFTTMIPIVGAVKYVYINETQVLGLFILITKKKSKDHLLIYLSNHNNSQTLDLDTSFLNITLHPFL